MRLDRLSDGSLLIEDRWDRFRQAWRAALTQLVLDDGRPAVRLDRERVLTIPVPIWDRMRRHVQQRLWGLPSKRERWCEGCGATMTVVKEFERIWTFRCPTCHSVEIQGKNRIGGTVGGGERERP